MDQYKHSCSAGGEQPSPSGVLIDRTSAGYNSNSASAVMYLDSNSHAMSQA